MTRSPSTSTTTTATSPRRSPRRGGVPSTPTTAPAGSRRSPTREDSRPTNKRDGFTTTYGYDDEDRQTERQAAGQGASRGQTVYDELGRTQTVIDPLSQATIYDYDEADRLEVIKSPRGDLTTYAYTDAGRLKTQANGENDNRRTSTATRACWRS